MTARLTVDQAAAEAHRHPATIRHALAAGELHGQQPRPRGKWLIQPACLDAWLSGTRCLHQQATRAA